MLVLSGRVGMLVLSGREASFSAVPSSTLLFSAAGILVHGWVHVCMCVCV
jgi:hypothetical protein